MTAADGGAVSGAKTTAPVGMTGAAGTVQLPGTARRLDAGALAALAQAYARWQANPNVYCAVMNITDAPGAVIPSSAPKGAEAIAHHQLVWQVDRFSKPAVALVDATHGGAAAALALAGTHKIAGDTYALVIDDLHQGWIPDLGLTAALGRLPGHLGAYFALSGRPLGRAAAWRWGLVTHCIATPHFAAIAAELAQADCVDPVLDDRHVAPGSSAETGDFATHEGLIERAFAGDSLAEIVAALMADRGPERAWAHRLADEINELDPIAVDLTLAMLRRPIGGDQGVVLMQDQRAALHYSSHLAVPLDLADPNLSLANLWLASPADGEQTLPDRNFIPTAPG